MKSFWIYCAVVRLSSILVWGFLLLLTSGAVTEGAKKRDIGELANVYLSVEHSLWLEGPIAWMATPEEIEQYLALDDDAAAEVFIEAFWNRLDPYPESYGNSVRELFEERSVDADKQFTEATQAGRRTARGTVYVLYGPPESVEYELAERAGGASVELWKYSTQSPPGLDGRKPRTTYQFSRVGDLTVFHRKSPR